ncbi:30S ribosomal protein S20, partial [Myxococcota bacterium]|nr:30S ribosomal protein S20 [Myxococcota bacterium]
ITTRVRSAIKKLHAELKKDDSAATIGALRNAESLIRRAASKGAIPKTRASRSISRLAKTTNQLSTN